MSWGGIDVTVLPPPPRPSGEPEPGIEPGAERLPAGPVLFYVDASGTVASMVPVAEIAGDSLEPLQPLSDARRYGENFIAEYLRQGDEYVLFHEGVRAGTFIVGNADLADRFCGPVPEATGTLELGAGGAGVAEFLALARVTATQVPRRTTERLEETRAMRVLAPILADTLLRSRRAQLPSDWGRARAQLRLIATGEGRNPGFTSTFLVGDTLGPGLDDAGHSLFFLALPVQMGYDTVFVSFRDYSETGKAAPRLIDFLDWDGDDSPELLIRVFGTNVNWFEAVGRGDDNEWRRIFAQSCEPDPAPTDTTAAADSSGTR